MQDAALAYLAGLPAFAMYFGSGVGLLALFIAIYVHVTPHREFRLIREGNTAAAASLAGAVIGFVLPLASSIENSVAFLDMLLWAAVALIVQTLGYLVVRALVPQISADIAAGKTASGVFLGAMAIALGILNAACMTY